MPITAQLQRFVDDELDRAIGLAEENVRLTLEQLQQPSPDAQRVRSQDLAQRLRHHAAQFVRRFSDALREVVHADMQSPHAPNAGIAEDARGLELMDESRVEVDIEVAGAAQLLLASAEWELRELQTFTSTLAGQQHVSNDTNPLHPQAYARALWIAAGEVSEDRAERSALLRAAARSMALQLKKAWAAACSRLESEGVEPGMYRTIVLPSGGRAERGPAFDLTQPGMLHALLQRMPVNGASGASSAASRDTLAQEARVDAALEHALERFERLLAESAAQRGGKVAARLDDHRDELMASTPDRVHRQIIELLSQLFEAMLADPRLPPAFRGVLARLQVSALRVALSDPTLMGSREHAVWRLMNRIGSAAETYTHAGDPRGDSLLRFCDALVSELTQSPQQDAARYSAILTRLDGFLGEQLREQQQHAQPTIAALARAEQRDEMAGRIAQRLHEQLQPVRATVALRRFVCGVWAKVLAEAMLRYGEKADETLLFLRTTDDLLWSVHPPDHPQSRLRLVAMLPGLLQRLRAGMALAEVPEAEQQVMLDELMALHTGALRPGGHASASDADSTPQELVQRMREETQWSPSPHGAFSDSLIDLASMETVPAELLREGEDAPAPASTGFVAPPVGSRHHLFMHGRWERVQLLWRSARGEFLLFAGPEPGRTHSITRRALERLGEEGLFKPLDDATLVQRAVDSLVTKLVSAT